MKELIFYGDANAVTVDLEYPHTRPTDIDQQLCQDISSSEKENKIRPPIQTFLSTQITKGGGNQKVEIIENVFFRFSGQLVTKTMLFTIEGMTLSLIWDMKQDGILKVEKIPGQSSRYPLHYRVTCNNSTTRCKTLRVVNLSQRNKKKTLISRCICT